MKDELFYPKRKIRYLIESIRLMAYKTNILKEIGNEIAWNLGIFVSNGLYINNVKQLDFRNKKLETDFVAIFEEIQSDFYNEYYPGFNAVVHVSLLNPEYKKCPTCNHEEKIISENENWPIVAMYFDVPGYKKCQINFQKRTISELDIKNGYNQGFKIIDAI